MARPVDVTFFYGLDNKNIFTRFRKKIQKFVTRAPLKRHAKRLQQTGDFLDHGHFYGVIHIC